MLSTLRSAIQKSLKLGSLWALWAFAFACQASNDDGQLLANLNVRYLDSQLDSFFSISNATSLARYIDSWCDTNPSVAMTLYRAFIDTTLNHNRSVCEQAVKPLPTVQSLSTRSINAALPLPSEAAMAWLTEAFEILHNGHPLRSDLPSLNPQQTSFLHRSFVKYPFLTARLFITVRHPLVGDEWQAFYPLVESALQSSHDMIDRRLLVWQKLRDDRKNAVWSDLFYLMQQADKPSLELVTQFDQSLTAEQHMELTLPLLENYLINSAYAEDFCDWAGTQQSQTMQNILAVLFNNMAEMIQCP